MNIQPARKADIEWCDIEKAIARKGYEFHKK